MEANGSADVARLAAQEGAIVQSITASMNSLRLVGLVPSFYNFKHTSAWWVLSKGWTERQKSKYKAWWDAFHELMRDKDDQATVCWIFACLLMEMARRNNHGGMVMLPGAFGIGDNAHAARVLEHVKSKYEALDPECGIGV